jgi:hypothetical protein
MGTGSEVPPNAYPLQLIDTRSLSIAKVRCVGFLKSLNRLAQSETPFAPLLTGPVGPSTAGP